MALFIFTSLPCSFSKLKMWLRVSFRVKQTVKASPGTSKCYGFNCGQWGIWAFYPLLLLKPWKVCVNLRDGLLHDSRGAEICNFIYSCNRCLCKRNSLPNTQGNTVLLNSGFGQVFGSLQTQYIPQQMVVTRGTPYRNIPDTLLGISAPAQVVNHM